MKYEAILQELFDGAVMSKFVTAKECEAYRRAVDDCQRAYRSCGPKTPQPHHPSKCFGECPNHRHHQDLEWDAARWRFARTIFSIEDIERTVEDMRGSEPTEEENAKADAAIDRARIPATGIPQEKS